MHSKLFIPSKVNVGFQNRQDTYTKKLAYVIYYDKKGVLRKETSWNSWRDQKIPNIEYDNTPTEGFVLNKGVGGYKSDWNFRSAHIRVYDPRDFEFEISVENLLFILKECDCTKGKGLEGKFVYAWQGTELVLLPASSLSYQESMGYTDLQGKKVTTKELTEGCTVLTKQQEKLIYLGRRLAYVRKGYYGSGDATYGKHHVFVDKDNKFVFTTGASNIGSIEILDCHPEYAELVDKFNNSKHAAKVIRFEKKPVSNNTYEFTSETECYQVHKYGGYNWGRNNIAEGSMVRYYRYEIVDNAIKSKYDRDYYNPEKSLGTEFFGINVVLGTGKKVDLEKFLGE